MTKWVQLLNDEYQIMIREDTFVAIDMVNEYGNVVNRKWVHFEDIPQADRDVLNTIIDLINSILSKSYDRVRQLKEAT